jgi:ATP-dependent protease ClpP protease subunit
MIEIYINDEISSSPYFGITETMIAEKLSTATPGEEIILKINSPGGSVYAGISIFNIIRETAKTHPVTVRVTGIAASMASYIALAARTVNKESKIIVSENAVFLIHNPWQIAIGDYREFFKAAEYLEKLAAMTGSTYAYVSGKAEKEIRALMDEESYFVGQEIIESGFGNEFEQINKTDETFELDRNNLIINAKLRIEKTIEKMRATAKADLEKAAALITETFLPPGAPGGITKSVERPASVSNAGGGAHFSSPSASPGETDSAGGMMNKDELKAKHPELYAAIYGEGKEAGAKEERERVEAHLKLGEDSGSMKVAAQFIREGKSVMEDKVQAEYLSARMNNGALKAREQDNPPPINPLAGGGADDDAALEAAWNHGIAGKDTQGVRT